MDISSNGMCSISSKLFKKDVTDGSTVSSKLNSSSLFCWSIHLKQSLIYLSSALSLIAFKSPYFSR